MYCSYTHIISSLDAASLLMYYLLSTSFKNINKTIQARTSTVQVLKDYISLPFTIFMTEKAGYFQKNKVTLPPNLF